MEKKLVDFDFGFQRSLDKGIINDIASLKFIHNAENVVLLGPPGVELI
jgi:DNA replication protein DnaC